MYHGSFPRQRGTGIGDPRSPVQRPLGRRRFLATAFALAVGGVAGGVGVRYLWGPARRDEAADGAGAPQPSADRGSLEWAIAMIDAPDAELLAAAGDLERVSARNRDEPRLVPCFERLLDLALRSDGPAADGAAACAIRSIVRLGRRDLALDREVDVAARPDLLQAAEAFERAAGGGRRR